MIKLSRLYIFYDKGWKTFYMGQKHINYEQWHVRDLLGLTDFESMFINLKNYILDYVWMKGLNIKRK